MISRTGTDLPAEIDLDAERAEIDRQEDQRRDRLTARANGGDHSAKLALLTGHMLTAAGIAGLAADHE